MYAYLNVNQRKTSKIVNIQKCFLNYKGYLRREGMCTGCLEKSEIVRNFTALNSFNIILYI